MQWMYEKCLPTISYTNTAILADLVSGVGQGNWHVKGYGINFFERICQSMNILVMQGSNHLIFLEERQTDCNLLL